MSIQELNKHRRDALNGMFNARDKYERAVHMNMYRWITSELKRHWQTTAMVTNAS